MKVEVVLPEEYMGDVIGDLNSRRGRIEGMEARPGTQIVTARWFRCHRCSVMPPICVRRTQGRATYTMHFAHYEEVPKQIADEIIARAQGREVEKSA